MNGLIKKVAVVIALFALTNLSAQEITLGDNVCHTEKSGDRVGNGFSGGMGNG